VPLVGTWRPGNGRRGDIMPRSPHAVENPTG
jgi:hypothetical protein